MTLDKTEAHELGRCYASPAHFISRHCQIEDAVLGDWIPFHLWPAQVDALDVVHGNQLSILLKARQVGMTWMVLAYALWLMIFRPAATVLMFSRRDDEAKHLLSQKRMRGIYNRLPAWMCGGHETTIDNAHEWMIANQSVARAFPTTGADSYSATIAIVDEADLSPDLNALMRSVKPTIDNGGKMILLSRADKSRPVSEFKRVYMEAKARRNGWAHIFLPWHVHPNRNAFWYEAQRADIQARTGSLDDLHEQYPASDVEALQPRSQDKRIPAAWLADVYVELDGTNLLGIPGLAVYREPTGGRQYVIGADPAEGNPNSDDSAATVLDKATGEEVAVLAGKLQPSTFASYVGQLARWYHNAAIVVERNNHGHAVLLWLQDNGEYDLRQALDEKSGWPTTSKSKALMYSGFTDAVRDKEVIIHSFETYAQLTSIDGSTLRAPEGQFDDRAMSFVLATIPDNFFAQKKQFRMW